MDYTIENDILKLTVTDHGGTMQSLIFKPTGEERLWQGNEYWKSKDVVIFPILGHAGSYTVCGKTYTPQSHGVVRYDVLTCQKVTQNAVTLTLSSNEQTRKTYPYEFDFAITYTLKDNSVEITYHVSAKTGTIPFYVGGHPGMLAPTGEAVVEFAQPEDAVLYPLESDCATHMPQLTRFVANKEFFASCKTLQLGNIAGGKVMMTTADGYQYTYLSDCPVWAFWSNESGGDYVCVEPWWGINDFSSAPRELSLKPFINFAGTKGRNFSYTLQINKI
jgi:galactose mutarotase-like enzyme